MKINELLLVTGDEECGAKECVNYNKFLECKKRALYLIGKLNKKNSIVAVDITQGTSPVSLSLYQAAEESSVITTYVPHQGESRIDENNFREADSVTAIVISDPKDELR